jgi:UDP-N-acetylmuramyl pentapeptide phosphotransferase/UDP-N-acetylglucosamine-1-phosphate transferase
MNIGLLCFGFLAGLLGAWVIMKFGGRIGINDIPSSRSSHLKIIPKGGGIGLLLAFVFSSLFFSFPAYFWVPGLFISLVSLWGDRHEISPGTRLLIQFGCALIFLAGYTGLSGGMGWLVLPLAVFIVGTSNFYNFMDGIDGIAGITGVVGFCLLWLFNSLIGGKDIYGMFCITMAMASTGFLMFNLPRAKVFMGDVGSILLGFSFACLMIFLAKSPGEFLLMAGFLSMFYLDEMFTMIIRIRDKESVLTPHRKHVYQLLANELGIEHWKVSLAYAFFQLLIGLALILAGPSRLWLIILIYGFVGLIFFFVSRHIRQRVYHS